MAKPPPDLIGQQFGRLRVTMVSSNKCRGRILWLCVCVCGKTTEATTGNLRSGGTRSCGCLLREYVTEGQRTHGHASKRHGVSPEYTTWCNMVARCTNPKFNRWAYYGGRGITVCDRWRESYETFLADVGPRPSPKHTIEREDGNGHYEPGNVIWATRKEQLANRSCTIWVEHGGVRRPLADVARELGVKYDTAHDRHRRGLPIVDCDHLDP